MKKEADKLYLISYHRPFDPPGAESMVIRDLIGLVSLYRDKVSSLFCVHEITLAKEDSTVKKLSIDNDVSALIEKHEKISKAAKPLDDMLDACGFVVGGIQSTENLRKADAESGNVKIQYWLMFTWKEDGSTPSSCKLKLRLTSPNPGAKKKEDREISEEIIIDDIPIAEGGCVTTEMIEKAQEKILTRVRKPAGA
jgi:hypothetical protein